METGDTQVTLPQNYVGRNNRSQEQRSVRLVEIGPRVTLQLLKIQKGFCEGDVLYHKYSTLHAAGPALCSQRTFSSKVYVRGQGARGQPPAPGA